MLKPVTPMDYGRASLRNGGNVPSVFLKAPASTTERLSFETPKSDVFVPGIPNSGTSSDGVTGWLTVDEGGLIKRANASWMNYIGSSSDAHGYSNVDISAGLRIKVNDVTATLDTSKSYTSKADILSQLASNIGSLTNVSASWDSTNTTFTVARDDDRELSLTVATTGANTAQNNALLTLLQGHTGNIQAQRTKGIHSLNGEVKVASGWAYESVYINDVAVDPWKTESIEGRVNAINDIQDRSGVSAKAAVARFERELSLIYDRSTPAASETAQSFSGSRFRLNGVELQLRSFSAGESLRNVVSAITSAINSHTNSGGALEGVRSFMDGNKLVIEAQDLNHGILLEAGSIRAERKDYLVSKLGGDQFRGPTIVLGAESGGAIDVRGPFLPESYLLGRSRESGLSEPDTERASLRLRFVPPDFGRLYLPHGLLRGGFAPDRTGAAMKISAKQETLAYSNVSPFNFKKDIMSLKREGAKPSRGEKIYKSFAKLKSFKDMIFEFQKPETSIIEPKNQGVAGKKTAGKTEDDNTLKGYQKIQFSEGQSPIHILDRKDG
ncbi:MAG: hypothetical protein VYA34_06815 [Myxococcota bacterium]|nr:hypothetical protein [Myxococcota bacterium]